MKTLLQDVRYGLRMLRKTPGFTAVAVITLALGIGANTAIFSLINAIMLRQLPVQDPQSLVSIKWTARSEPTTASAYIWGGCPDAMPTTNPVPEGCIFSYPMYQLIKSEQKVFSAVTAMVPSNVPVNAAGHSSRAAGLCVSGNFFSMLGARPALGRLLNPGDDDSSASPAAVVSYRFWKTFLNSDATVVGKSILFGKARYTLVGVATSEFGELDPGVPNDFWVPLSFQPGMAFEKKPKSVWLAMLARLKPGINAAQAKSAISALFTPSATNGPMAIFKPSDLPRIELPSGPVGRITGSVFGDVFLYGSHERRTNATSHRFSRAG